MCVSSRVWSENQGNFNMRALHKLSLPCSSPFSPSKKRHSRMFFRKFQIFILIPLPVVANWAENRNYYESTRFLQSQKFQDFLPFSFIQSPSLTCLDPFFSPVHPVCKSLESRAQIRHFPGSVARWMCVCICERDIERRRHGRKWRRREMRRGRRLFIRLHSSLDRRRIIIMKWLPSQLYVL